MELASTDPPAVVPTLTSGSILFSEKAHFYYPFGNSVAVDLLLNHDPKLHDHLDVLLCGCGDLRNVAYTLREAQRKGTTAPEIAFTLDDIQPAILARNLLIARVLASDTAMGCPDLVRYVGQLWYSLELEPDVRAFWDDRMRECLARDDWLVADSPIRVADAPTLQAVRHCWRSWLHVDWSTATLATKRRRFLDSTPKHSLGVKNVEALFDSFTDALAQNYMLHAEPHLSESRLNELKRQAGALVKSGVYLFNRESEKQQPTASPKKKGKQQQQKQQKTETTVARASAPTTTVSPTMLSVRDDGEVFYAVHYGSFPMEAFRINLHDRDLEDGMALEFADWLDGLRTALRPEAAPRTRITMVLGHALQVLEGIAADPHQRFDVIDTSNIIDSCGLLNVVLHASAVLKPNRFPDRSLLHTHSFIAFNIGKTRAEYLARVTELPLETFPTLFGVHLLEATNDAHWSTFVQPFAWSKIQMSRISNRAHEEFTFFKTDTPAVPVNLIESPFITDALVECAKKLCTMGPMKLQTPGGPGTTAALIPKILAYAFASGRLTTDGARRLPSSAPRPCLSALWNTLRDVRSLSGSMTEIFTQAQLHGFAIDLPEMAKDKFVYRIDATVPLEFGESPTPNFHVEVMNPMVSFAFESLHYRRVQAGTRLAVTFYVPQFVLAMPQHTVKVGFFRSFPLAPNGKPERALLGGEYKPINTLKVTKVPVGAMRAATDGIAAAVAAAAAASADESATWPLPVDRVTESQYELEVQLVLPPGKADAKFGLDNNNERVAGRGASAIRVNGAVQRMRFATATRVKKVLAARKQGRLTLVLTKVYAAGAPSLGVPLPGPYVHLKDRTVLVRSGTKPTTAVKERVSTAFNPMFGIAEINMRVKAGSFDAIPGISSAYRMTFDLKESIRNFAERYTAGHSVFLVSDKSRGGFGLVFLYDLVLLPERASGKAPTPAFDAVFAALPPKASLSPAEERKVADALASVALALPHGQTITLGVSDDEAMALCEYLDRGHASSVDKSVPATLPGGKTPFPAAIRPMLKRAVLLPLYPASGLEHYEEDDLDQVSGAPGLRGARGGGVRTKMADTMVEMQEMFRKMMESGIDEQMLEAMGPEAAQELVKTMMRKMALEKKNSRK
ncbi:hypothetical protein H9P43_003794 [Blastocladiella emersonii ATCC 22665]|nr:hypothetical protein H9P43_003794 [Blastocladiella emersonii ATCC 22665]